MFNKLREARAESRMLAESLAAIMQELGMVRSQVAAWQLSLTTVSLRQSTILEEQRNLRAALEKANLLKNPRRVDAAKRAYTKRHIKKAMADGADVSRETSGDDDGPF